MSDRRMGKRSKEERGSRNFYILRLATALISFYFAYDLFITVREGTLSSDKRWIIYLVIIAFIIIGCFLIYLFIRDFRKMKEEEKEINERNKEEKEQLKEMREARRQSVSNPSGMSLAEKAAFLSGKNLQKSEVRYEKTEHEETEDEETEREESEDEKTEDEKTGREEIDNKKTEDEKTEDE